MEHRAGWDRHDGASSRLRGGLRPTWTGLRRPAGRVGPTGSARPRARAGSRPCGPWSAQDPWHLWHPRPREDLAGGTHRRTGRL